MVQRIERVFRRILFLCLAGLNILLFGILGSLFVGSAPSGQSKIPFLTSAGEVTLYQAAGAFFFFLVFIAYGFIFRLFPEKPAIREGLGGFDAENTFLSFEGNYVLTGAKFSLFLFYVTFGAFGLFFSITWFLTFFNIGIPLLIWLFIILGFPFFRGLVKF